MLTMADLLPSIDSDEEFEAPADAIDDGDDGNDAMETSFQFGGILVSQILEFCLFHCSLRF